MPVGVVIMVQLLRHFFNILKINFLENNFE